MRGHIHKRVRKTRGGKETTRWYVVVDVGVDANGRSRIECRVPSDSCGSVPVRL